MIHRLDYMDLYKGYNYKILYNGYEDLYNFKSDQLKNEWYCGYVCIENYLNIKELKFKYFKYLKYFENNIDCHGGITFFDVLDDNKLYIGFDCNHFGDSIQKCNIEYCKKQCQYIIDQLIEMIKDN